MLRENSLRDLDGIRKWSIRAVLRENSRNLLGCSASSLETMTMSSTSPRHDPARSSRSTTRSLVVSVVPRSIAATETHVRLPCDRIVENGIRISSSASVIVLHATEHRKRHDASAAREVRHTDPESSRSLAKDAPRCKKKCSPSQRGAHGVRSETRSDRAPRVEGSS